MRQDRGLPKGIMISIASGRVGDAIKQAERSKIISALLAASLQGKLKRLNTKYIQGVIDNNEYEIGVARLIEAIQVSRDIDK